MLKPLGQYISIKPAEEDTGLVKLADQSKEEPQKGEVLAIGEFVESKDLKVGMTVFYKKYSPDEFDINGEKVLLVLEEDVMGYETE